MFDKDVPARGAYVGLAPPGEAGSWQRESKVGCAKFPSLITCLIYLIIGKFGCRIINFGAMHSMMVPFPLRKYVLEITISMHGCLDL